VGFYVADPKLQEYAKDALRGGLLRYSSGKGWSAPNGWMFIF
jgi:hypothetical protein